MFQFVETRTVHDALIDVSASRLAFQPLAPVLLLRHLQEDGRDYYYGKSCLLIEGSSMFGEKMAKKRWGGWGVRHVYLSGIKRIESKY